MQLHQNKIDQASVIRLENVIKNIYTTKEKYLEEILKQIKKVEDKSKIEDEKIKQQQQEQEEALKQQIETDGAAIELEADALLAEGNTETAKPRRNCIRNIYRPGRQNSENIVRRHDATE